MQLVALSQEGVKVNLLITMMQFLDAVSGLNYLLETASQVVTQHHGFGNFFHGFAPILALPLHHPICVILAVLKLALQDSFCPIDISPSCQSVQEYGILTLQSHPLDFGTHQETDGRDQLDLTITELVSLAILHVYDTNYTPPADYGNRQESFEPVLRQFVEQLEASVRIGALPERNGFQVLRHPARDALPHFHFQSVHNL